MNVFKRYWHTYRAMFISGVLCVFFEAVCDLLQPTIMSLMIDNGVAQKNMHSIIIYGAIMLLTAGVGAFFAVSRNVLAGRVSQNLSADMRRDLFCKVQKISLAGADEIENASLITRLTNDVNHLSMFAGGLMRIMLKAPLMCVGGIIMSFFLSVRDALILLGAVLVVFVFIFLSMKLSYPLFAGMQKALDKLNRIVREYLLGIRLVKAFGRNDYETEKFGSANSALADISTKAARILAVFTPLMLLVMHMGIVAVLAIAGISSRIGTVMALVSYITQIAMSLMIVSNIFNIFVRTRASAERVNEVFQKPEEDKSSECELNGIETLSFLDVCFSYPSSDGHPTLKHVSFECERGDTIAVIGPTGGGKTTLVSLLMRFYRPTTGAILINGTDIQRFGADSLRAKTAYAPQRALLFSGTIRENLKWGKEDASDNALFEVIHASQSDEFVSDLSAPLEQGAVNVSGGQKQRLSVARALARGAELLILDDCTGALDVICESRLMEELSRDSKERITLWVTQRVSVSRRATKVLLLVDGEQVAFDSHEKLMRDCAAYRDIYSSQTGGALS